MAGFWPIENIWSIIRDKVSDDPQTKPQLKRSITKSWKSIDDKALCKKLIHSKQLEAVIKKKGELVQKEDYNYI